MKHTRIVKVEGGIFKNKLWYKFADNEGATRVDLRTQDSEGNIYDAPKYLMLDCSIEEAVEMLIDALKNTGATYERLM